MKRLGSLACSLVRGTLAVIALAALLPALALGDLYGPSAPPDAGWVRALNAEASGGLGIRIADGSLESVAFGDATPYHAVAPGEVRVDIGGEVIAVEVEAGAFLTVVAMRDGPLVIEDTPLVDVSRGLLALYNLTALESLELFVVDGPEVVSGVAPGSQAAVAVAEAEVGLEVRAGDELIGGIGPQIFERGVAHSIVVVEGPDGPVVRYLKAVAAE
jgi:hypothetical protein